MKKFSFRIFFIYIYQTGGLGGRYFTASLFSSNPFKSRSARTENKHLKTNHGIRNPFKSGSALVEDEHLKTWNKQRR